MNPQPLIWKLGFLRYLIPTEILYDTHYLIYENSLTKLSPASMEKKIASHKTENDQTEYPF